MSDQRTIEELSADLMAVAEAMSKSFITLDEAYRVLGEFSELARRALPTIDLRQVGKMRAGMMIDNYGIFAVFMPTFWRWLWMAWRREP